MTTDKKVRNGVLKWAIVRIAAFCWVNWCHNWNPEVLNHQKMVSHAQIGPGRAEIAQSQVVTPPPPKNGKIWEKIFKFSENFYMSFSGNFKPILLLTFFWFAPSPLSYMLYLSPPGQKWGFFFPLVQIFWNSEYKLSRPPWATLLLRLRL